MNPKISIAILFILVLVLAVLPDLGHAEFYKYKDTKGVWHFTDNLNEVPEDQRPDVRRYKEADDTLTPLQRYKKRQSEEAVRRKAEKRSGKHLTKKKKKIYSSKQRTLLEKKKASLEQEKTALVKEQQSLYKFNVKLADEVGLKVHKRKVAKLNRRIMAYEKKRQRFELEVAKFNSE